MKNLRKPFPILKQYIYFNTAASGLLSQKVFEFRQDHDLDFLISGSLLKEKHGVHLSEVRETVGRFFNCAPNRIALVPNFSFGFNTLLEGIDKSKTILLLGGDYPSINRAVTSRDFQVKWAAINEKIEDNIEKVFEVGAPDVFAFSVVQYINGIQLDLDFLRNLKKKFPETLFVADGTQFCGTRKFDFETSGLDVMIASCYKWLNAGYGNAFILFNEKAVEKIAPKSSGFNSLQGKYKAQEGNFIGKFEPGHQDTLNFGSLKTALNFLTEVGMEVVEERVEILKNRAKLELTKLDVLEEMVVKRAEHSSIFNIKGDERLFQHLRSKNILCSQRGEGIRVSFHYFNTAEEQDVLFEALRDWLKK